MAKIAELFSHVQCLLRSLFIIVVIIYPNKSFTLMTFQESVDVHHRAKHYDIHNCTKQDFFVKTCGCAVDFCEYLQNKCKSFL